MKTLLLVIALALPGCALIEAYNLKYDVMEYNLQFKMLYQLNQKISSFPYISLRIGNESYSLRLQVGCREGI